MLESASDSPRSSCGQIGATTDDRRARVVVVGGGITGVEGLLGLHELAGDRVDLTLISPEPELTYKPLLVEELFFSTPAPRHDLAELCDQLGARFVHQAVIGLHAAEKFVALADGSELAYDLLVICVGACCRPAYTNAITFPSPEPRLRVEDLIRAAGDATGRIAFVVPPGASWPLPIYELAMLTQRRAREQRSNVTCIVVTPEAAPLLMFGSAASGAVAELLRTRGIEFEAASSAHETTTGEITLVPGQRELNADIVVALPQLHPAPIAGLTSGFIPIDAHARVPGLDGVYAAGDATMFPIKQGGLGTQQADAAVEHIAALVGAEIDPKPFHPILRGKLLTGDETISLRHDVTGGTGEGQASPDYLWWPPHKVAGRYLAAWLGHSEPCDPEPPAQGSLEVEISLPQEWHEQPMALDPYGKL